MSLKMMPDPATPGTPSSSSPASTGKVRDTSGTDVMIDPAPAQQRKRRLLVAAAAAGVLLILALVWLINAWSSSKVVASRARLRIATVTAGSFVRDVAAEGTVVVANSPTLVATGVGTVTFHVVAGDAVTPGQLLASVDSPTLKNELDRERATLDGLTTQLQRQEIETHRQILESKQTVDLAAAKERTTERELERTRTGLEQGVVPRRDLDKAQDERDDAKLTHEHAVANAHLQEDTLNFDLKNKRTDVERQRLVVADLSRRVDALQVRSPVKGMVGSLLVAQAATVTENAGLLTVVDLSALEVEFSVAESYATDLAAGMTSEISYAGKSYRGTVTSISPEVQQSEVKGRVRFAQSVPPGVRQNQRVSVRIVLDQRDHVLKVERGEFVNAGSYVYQVDGSLAIRKPVTLGPMSVGEVQILSGLHAGDQIVVSSVSDFGDASQVRLSD